MSPCIRMRPFSRRQSCQPQALLPDDGQSPWSSGSAASCSEPPEQAARFQNQAHWSPHRQQYCGSQDCPTTQSAASTHNNRPLSRPNTCHILVANEQENHRRCFAGCGDYLCVARLRSPKAIFRSLSCRPFWGTSAAPAGQPGVQPVEYPHHLVMMPTKP